VFHKNLSGLYAGQLDGEGAYEQQTCGNNTCKEHKEYQGAKLRSQTEMQDTLKISSFVKFY